MEFENGQSIYNQIADNLSDKITMNSDEFFVHGDNNLDSLDSNKLGPIKTDEIFGKVVFRLWPFNKIGIINSLSTRKSFLDIRFCLNSYKKQP